MDSSDSRENGKSPNQSKFVTVNGVRLHYLDWGGRGKALLFLAGMGDTAHIFDDIAPKFTDRFRVLALTRRGHGQSDKPETGYDTATLVEDVRQFLDRMNISRVNLVGHSIAGDEMTKFATLYPNRVARLVYLDAAYDRSALPALNEQDPVSPPSPPSDFSLDAVRQWLRSQFGFWSEAQEADMREKHFVMPDGTVRFGIPRRASEALMRNMAESRPDYAKVEAPALSFYSVASLNVFYPWLLSNTDEETRKKAQEYLSRHWNPYQRVEIERFRKGMAKERIVELADTHHYCFLQRQNEVARRMRRFLLKE